MIEYDMQSHTQIIIKEVIFQNFLKKELKIHLYHSHKVHGKYFSKKKSYISSFSFIRLFPLAIANRKCMGKVQSRFKAQKSVGNQTCKMPEL